MNVWMAMETQSFLSDGSSLGNMFFEHFAGSKPKAKFLRGLSKVLFECPYWGGGGGVPFFKSDGTLLRNTFLSILRSLN